MQERRRRGRGEGLDFRFGEAAAEVALDNGADARVDEALERGEEHRIGRPTQNRRVNGNARAVRPGPEGIVEALLEVVADEKREAKPRRNDPREGGLAGSRGAADDDEPRATR